MKDRRIKIENYAIYATVLVAVFMLVFSFIPRAGLERAMVSVLEMSRIVQRVFAIAILITAVNLRKRKRSAWVVTISVLGLSVVLQLAHTFFFMHAEIVALLICKLVLLTIFLSTREDFCSPMDKHSARIGALFGILAIFGLFINVGAGFYMFHYQQGLPRGNSIVSSLTFAWAQMFQVGPTYSGVSFHGIHFERFAFWVTWLGIILAVFFILRPFLMELEITDSLHRKARKLVNLYGQNIASYLALEDDKTLYFGKKVEGVVAYGTYAETIIVQGDPICAPEDFPILLDEFTEFAIKSAYNLFFMCASEPFIEEYKKLGYGFVKCGVEARFDLEEYNLKGKKAAKMRMNVNHATKAGLTILEYKVLEKRDSKLDDEFDRITKEWLQGKNSGELGFSVGTVGLDNPMDKRYFYAVDEAGTMQGFVVFVPFDNAQGYMADVTRRANDAPWGITETIVYEAFQVFKEEGVKWGSMGLAPLAGLVEEGEQPGIITQMMEFIYKNMNSIYGFKSLYQAKVKYNPSQWNPQYFAYLPKVPTPQMLYAAVCINNKQGMMDFIKAFFKGQEKKRLMKEAKKVTED